MDWKKEFAASVDRQEPLNEDAGLGAALAVGGVVGAKLAMDGISGMHGRYVRDTGRGTAGPISRGQKEFAAHYPTSYSPLALIKHAIIGKSGTDKEMEVNNAERSHREALHRGDAKAIEINGSDPMEAVRHGVKVADSDKHHVAYVSAVLDHAKQTDNDYAEPHEDEEDFRDHYDVEHAAAEHLARVGAVPRWGDHQGHGEYYLDRVYKHEKTGKMMATYRENRSPYGYDHEGRRTRYMPLTKHVEIT